MLVSVQAGNSDNKLTQGEWAKFAAELSEILAHYEVARHFHGGPPTTAPWQNVCIVIELADANVRENMDTLFDKLAVCRAKHKQDSVCVLWGLPTFV